MAKASLLSDNNYYIVQNNINLSGSFDQSLNTTDNVEFHDIKVTGNINMTDEGIYQNRLSAFNQLGLTTMRGAKIRSSGGNGYYTLGSGEDNAFLYYENTVDYPSKLVYMSFNLSDESIHIQNPLKIDITGLGLNPDDPVIEIQDGGTTAVFTASQVTVDNADIGGIINGSPTIIYDTQDGEGTFIQVGNSQRTVSGLAQYSDGLCGDLDRLYGSGTKFTEEVFVGDVLTIDNIDFGILTIVSDTILETDNPAPFGFNPCTLLPITTDSFGSTFSITEDGYINSYLMPNTTTLYDIGSSSRYWKSLYSTNAYHTTLSSSFINSFSLNGNINFNGDTIDIGTPTDRGDYIFFNQGNFNDSIVLEGVYIDSWDDVNQSGEGSLWINDSGKAIYNGNVGINGYLRLGSNETASWPIEYLGDGHDRVISIEYNRSGALVSPFYYKVSLPDDTSGSPIATVNQIYLDSYSNRSAGTDNIYGNYLQIGKNSPTWEQGTKYIIADRTILQYDYPFGSNAGGTQYFGKAWTTVQHATNFAMTQNTGKAYAFHDWATYNQKAQNVFGGTRTYETWGYRAVNFDNCQSYDECHGFWSENSDNLIDGGLWNESGNTGLHNNPHIEVYNVTENGYALTISSLNTWYNITGLQQGETSDFTISGDSLVATYDGRYQLSGALSFSGSGGSTHSISVLINGVEHSPCRIYRKLGTAGDVGALPMSCIITLNAGDKVTGAVQDISSPAQNINIWSINTNLVRINE